MRNKYSKLISRVLCIASVLLSVICFSPRFIQSASSAPGATITYTVDRTDDFIIPGGCLDGVIFDCSLRTAINLIPSFAPDAYIINIPDGVYTLDYDPDADGIEDTDDEGDLDIPVANVTLQGESMADTIIDGNNTDRVLDLFGTSNIFSLNDLTIRNGRLLEGEGGGGGIRINGGNLVANRVTITHNTVEGIYYGCPGACVYLNTGGGIYETGSASLAITDSTISNNSAVWGGGIDHQDNTTLSLVGSNVAVNTAIRNGGGLLLRSGTTTIERSVITGNTGEVGGGISNFPGTTLSISDSTIDENISTTSGGGIDTWASTTLTNVTIDHNYAAYHGGGLEVWGALGFGITLIEMTNVTLFDNSTPGGGGGIYVGYQGSASMDHVTLAGNTASGGYAIQAHYGSVTAINTIFSSSSSGGTCGFDNGGSLTTSGYNLSSDASCSLGASDLVNQDLHFGAFGDFGGLTPTQRILTGSPAINFGNPADASGRLDQRGISIIGGRSDSGAFEFIPPILWLPIITRP